MISASNSANTLNISAAALEIVAASDVTAVFVYDTAKDSDGGAWRNKTSGTSWYKETLNTSTRGSRAQFPSKALIVCRSSSLAYITIYDLDDPACPMWMSGFGNDFILQTYQTSVKALNGHLYFGANNVNGYAPDMDLIANRVTMYTMYGTFTAIGGIENRGSWANGGVTSQATFVGVVNDIAVTVLPLTQFNPLRCNLPNPTIALGLSGGTSIVRHDGVVVNSASSTAVISTCFDKPKNPQVAPNLWTVTASNLYVTNSYLAASWNNAAIATFTAAQLNVGTLVSVRAIPGGVAVAGSTGLEIGRAHV